MVVDPEIQPQLILSTPATPLSPLFIPGPDLQSFLSFTHSQDVTSNSLRSSESNVPRHRKPRVFKVNTILASLQGLRDARISVMDLVFAILDGESSNFYSYRLAFLSDNKRIQDLLDIIWMDKKSKPAFESWFKDDGVQYVCKLVSKEMESAKPMLKMNISDVTPQYIEKWDINEIMNPVAAVTPTWTKILYAASEPQKKNDSSNSDTRNRPTVCFFFHIQTNTK